MVTKEEVDNKLRGLADFRKACLRNGFLVPDLKSRICTREFLQEVRAGQCFVPKIEGLKSGVCVEPPSNEVVRNELVAVIQNGI